MNTDLALAMIETHLLELGADPAELDALRALHSIVALTFVKDSLIIKKCNVSSILLAIDTIVGMEQENIATGWIGG
jgi:hypothetical protein